MLRVARSGVLRGTVLATSSPALAAPAVPHGTPFEVVAPAGEFCPFALRIAGVSSSTVRPGTASGNLIVTGVVTVTVTNLETIQSRRYNISGPTFIDAETGRLVLTGTALVGQPASQNVGSTFLIVTRGRVTFTPANTIESHHGTIAHNICTELA